jgi:hypothetical protein
MPIVMKGCYFFVQPGQKRFEISSNFANYLELGIQSITSYYLEAKIENDEFKISGTLLDRNGRVLCSLENNFIETSRGCSKEMTRYGYRIKNNEGDRIFEIRVEDNVCHLEGTIYSDLGEIIAQGKEGKFVILKGPAIIGKSNGSIGLKIG